MFLQKYAWKLKALGNERWFYLPLKYFLKKSIALVSSLAKKQSVILVSRM